MFKRILSLVLIFVMLPAMVLTLPEEQLASPVIQALRTRSAAQAEALGAAGTDYADFPEEARLTDGDWTYAVLPDGYAVILEYHGASDRPVVPEALGGCWVTSIAKAAFTQPLSSIKIHGNVTSIAEDAFACEHTFIISAYNGTHALSYAAARQIPCNNLSSLDFAEGVIDFSDINRSHYNYISSSQLLLNRLEGRRVSVGSMLYMPPDGVYELGEAFEVLSVTETSGGMLLTITKADPAAVLDRILLDNVTLVPDVENIIFLTDGVSLDEEALQLDQTNKANFGGSLAKRLPLLLNIVHGNWEIRGGLEFELTASVSADISIWPFKVNSYTVKQECDTSFKVRARYNKVNKDLGDNKILHKEFAIAKVPIASNGLLTGYFVIKMQAKVYGEIEFTYEVETVTGETYYNGRKSPINQKTTKKVELTGGATAKFLATPSLMLNAPIIGSFAELSAGVGPSFSAKGTTTIPIENDPDFTGCIDISLDLVLEVSLKLGLLKDKNKYIGGIVIDGKWNIFNFHIEDWKIIETCSRGRKVVQFYSAPGTSVASQSVITGTRLTRPADPIRPGYAFTGWYTASDLITKWNFTSAVTQNMVLYGGWKLTDPSAVDPEVEAGNSSMQGNSPDVAYLKYTISNGTATITGYNGNPTRLNIPAQIDGATVTAIAANSFKKCTSLTEITFPDTLQTIGNHAFDGCTELNGTISFPDRVVLGSYAFQNCYEIDDLDFRGYVTLEYATFKNCYGLTSIYLPDDYTIANGVFEGCSNIKKLSWVGIAIIGTTAVHVNSTTSVLHELKKTLEEVEYRSSGTHVVGSQFNSFTALRKVTLPEELRVIGKYAFANCPLLSIELDLSDVEYIGQSAFSNCPYVHNLQLSDQLTTLGPWAFYNCTGLAGTIDIKGADLQIGHSVFEGCKNITKVILSASSTEIWDGVFANCSALEEVVLNTGVNYYPYFGRNSYNTNNIFAGCSNLKKLTFGGPASAVGEIDEYMLKELSETVEEITLNEGTYRIGSRAFADFSKLRVVHFPSTIQKINANAFYNCWNLETVDLLLADDVTVASGAFACCPALQEVRFGKNVVSVAADAFASSSDFNAVCYYGTPADECLKATEGASISYFRDDYLLTIDYQADGYKTSSMYPAGKLLTGIADYQRDGWALTGWYTNAEGTGSPVDIATMVMPAANLTLYAHWTNTVSDFTYLVEDGNATITGYMGYDTALVIPAEVDGYPVVGIAAQAIGESVEHLTIPASVTAIDPLALVGSASLAGFTVGEDNPAFMAADGALFSKDGAQLLRYAPASAATVYTIPDGVATISAWAFAGADNLTAVTLSEQITALPEHVFDGCTALSTVTLPDGMAAISETAFLECPLEMTLYFTPGHAFLTAYAEENMINCNLYTLSWYVGDELVYSADYQAGKLMEALPLDAELQYESWGGWIAQDSDTLWDFATQPMPAQAMSLYAVKIADFAYEIHDGTVTILSYVGSKTEIPAPTELEGCPVTQISDTAFEGLEGFTIIADAGSVWETYASAHGYAFRPATVTVTYESNGGTSCAPATVVRLTGFAAPSTVRTGYTFTGWYTDAALTTLWNFETGIASADMTLYAGWQNDGTAVDTHLTYSDDGQGVTITGYTGIKGTVVIPESINGLPVTAIADYAFYASSAIATITLPDTVTSIGSYAFAHSTLTEVTLPDSVTSIGESAFADCTRLTFAILGTGCTQLPAYLFDGCTALIQLTVPEGITAIGRNFAANARHLLSVSLPDSLVELGSYAFSNCVRLQELSLGANVNYLQANMFSRCHALQNLHVDSSNLYYTDVDGVLYDKDGTTLVCYPAGRSGDATIPEGVLILGQSCFADTGVTQITIPSSIMSIASQAFAGCTALEQIHFAADPTLTHIGSSAFSGCGKLTEVTLPACVSTLGDDAFAYCTALTALTVPAAVTTIGADIVPAHASLVLYGQEGSAIEAYAAANGLRFIDPDTMIAVESIALETDNLSIAPGQSSQLEALLSPSNCTETSVTWASSDASIASIDATGTLTAHRFGSCRITATAANGATATMTVTVEAPRIPVTGVMLNSASAVTVDQYELVQVLAHVLPTSASNQTLNWTSSNDSIAAVDQTGLVTALKPGTAVITASSAENESFNIQMEITVEPIVFTAAMADEITVISPNRYAWLEYTTIPYRHEVQATWTSSDPSVVSVDESGFVTAVGTGPAVISVQITDGYTTVELTRTVFVTAITTYTLPQALTAIEEEAFANTPVNKVVLGSKVTAIGSRAFADSPNLLYVTIPASVQSIAEDAFAGCDYLTLLGSEGSLAQEYAEAHGFHFKAQ